MNQLLSTRRRGQKRNRGKGGREGEREKRGSGDEGRGVVKRKEMTRGRERKGKICGQREEKREENGEEGERMEGEREGMEKKGGREMKNE